MRRYWEGGARYRAGRRPWRAVWCTLPLAHWSDHTWQQEAAAAASIGNIVAGCDMHTAASDDDACSDTQRLCWRVSIENCHVALLLAASRKPPPNTCCDGHRCHFTVYGVIETQQHLQCPWQILLGRAQMSQRPPPLHAPVPCSNFQHAHWPQLHCACA